MSYTNELKDYLLAFIVGSSVPVTFFFVQGFFDVEKHLNKDHCAKDIAPDLTRLYPGLAPLYFGFMTMLIVFISKRFKFNLQLTFLVMSILSAIIVSTTITACKVYTYPKQRYIEQYFRLVIYHMIAYNLIIYPIYAFLHPKLQI